MEDSIEHAMFGCLWMHQVWLRHMNLSALNMARNSLEEWLTWAARGNQPRRANEVHSWPRLMIVGWVVWKARCKFIFEGNPPVLDQVLREIDRLGQEMAKPPRTHGQQQQLMIAWYRPPRNTIKINCDASWSATTGRRGVAVIARDDSGHVVGGSSYVKPAISAEVMEAEAILAAVNLSYRMGWTRVMFESDALCVINHLRVTDFSWRLDTILSNAATKAS